MHSSKLGYQTALQAFEKAREWGERLRQMENIIACGNNANPSGCEREARGLRDLLRKTVRPGIYEHWKSAEDKPMFYAVLGVDFDITTPGQFMPPSVRYHSLYGKEAGQAVRRELLDPEDGFLMPIHRPQSPTNPYIGPRFRLRCVLDPALVIITADSFKNKKRARRVRTRSHFLQMVERMRVAMRPPQPAAEFA